MRVTLAQMHVCAHSPDLKTFLRHQALALGFDLFGVTTPDPPEHFTVYARWLDAGRHGEMGYLAREDAQQRRADPRRILPQCRSIWVLGMRHASVPQLSATGETPPRELSGRIAAYAWGEDYHQAFSWRMQRLVEMVREKFGGELLARGYADTGPILERDLAQRAGLGWIGKHTCLIHPRLGSYFLLGEILSSVELEPDAPFSSDHCGTCQRCVQACPTNCILPDRTIDSRRCISYLTIELKGAIPLELRPSLGYWVFGCDICQQVCPWNVRFAPRTQPAILTPRPEMAAPRLIEELALSPQAFQERFRHSAVKRARRRGYLRNVAVALGNSGDRRAVPPLIETLRNEPEALVRQHAAWALRCLGGAQAHRALEQCLKRESDPQVLAEIRQALD